MHRPTRLSAPDMIEWWNIGPGCWVEIRFHGVPTWRGLRRMFRRLRLIIPESGARVYEIGKD
jgi:hypothetical protein